MSKKLFVLIFLVICGLFLVATPISALDRPHFVSFINPVRGPERGTSPVQTPLDLPIYQYQLAKENNFPVDWLLRFDAVESATISGYFKTITATDSSQMVGAFLEVTPNLALAAGVEYPKGDSWSIANRIFLSGYSQPDRLKLIDIYMDAFYLKFGYYPAVVGAWHLDAFSLEYLSKHYSVITAVVCDEQYNTDSYRFWGGYLGSPYFPSKNNFLVPATTRDNRINIALTKWAQRDPFSFYGIRNESNFSVQVNDYTSQGLKTNFFSDLIGIYSNSNFNEFTQTNIGLENDYSLAQFRSELKDSYQTLRAIQGRNNLVFISSKDFGQWLATRYTFTNPAYFYTTPDVSGRQAGTVYWYQNPFYRLGLKSSAGQTWIIDFRLYNQSEAEEHYLTKNNGKMLYAEVNPTVDSIKYPNSALPLAIDLEKAEITYQGWKVTFRQADKAISLQPEKIVFSNLTPPVLDTEEIKIRSSSENTTWFFAPSLPFAGKPWIIGLVLGFTSIICLFLVSRQIKTSQKVFLIVGWLTGLVSLITVFRSGLVYRFGLGFWGPNGHDAIFHLSLGEHFKNSLFSLAHPQLAGQLLSNYHFGFDWITAFISKLTGISLLDIYFRAVPLMIIILIVLVTTKLLQLWRFSGTGVLLALALIFLAGSAGFIPAFFLGRSLFGGESIFWANQSVSLLLNPPFALSILVLLVFLLFLENHPHRLTKKEWLVLSLLGGVLVQIKIYAFILLVAALFMRRKFKLTLSVGLLGLLFILPSLGSGSFPFTLSPLWFVRSMFESYDRVYFRQLAEAWQVYENNGVIYKLILVNIFAVVVFYLGNLWIRAIGLWRVISGGEPTLSGRLAQTIVVLGLLIPLIFTQKINPWNTIQFLYYSLFFLGLFTAGQITDWFSKTKNHLLLTICCLFILFISLPTTIGTLRDYLTSQSASRISLTELRALDLIRRSPRGVVISPLTYARSLPAAPDPLPLYRYASTAYISALTGQPEYLSDTINLDITGFSYKDRVKNVIRLYQTRDPLWVKQFLSQNNIRYIYETPDDKIRVRSEDACLIKIFDSGEINLYKYSCK